MAWSAVALAMMHAAFISRSDPRGSPEITQLVNESAGANLRATKMLIDMMKDIERNIGAEPPPKPYRFAAADEEVVRGFAERARGALLREIQGHERGQPGSGDDFLAASRRPGQPTPLRRERKGDFCATA